MNAEAVEVIALVRLGLPPAIGLHRPAQVDAICRLAGDQFIGAHVGRVDQVLAGKQLFGRERLMGWA